MNEIEKYRKRRDARIKKRMDEEWVTIKGTHVLIDDDGQVKGGPDRVKSLIKEGGGYKKGTKKITKGAPIFNVTNSRAAEERNARNRGGWAKNAQKPKTVAPKEKAEEKGSAQDAWKSQIREMARGGEIPSYIGGSKEQRASAMKEINKLYDKPSVKHRFVDQGDAAWISYADGTGITSRVSYPSGENASQEEKDGVVKFMLHSHIKKYGSGETGRKPTLEKAREKVEAWKNKQDRTSTREDDFAAEGYRKNKEGRWERK